MADNDMMLDFNPLGGTPGMGFKTGRRMKFSPIYPKPRRGEGWGLHWVSNGECYVQMSDPEGQAILWETTRGNVG